MDLKLFERQSRFNIQTLNAKSNMSLPHYMERRYFVMTFCIFDNLSDTAFVISFKPKHYACLFEHIRGNIHMPWMREKSPKFAYYAMHSIVRHVQKKLN